MSRRCLRRNLRYVAKFLIMLALKFKFALPILPVCKVKLVFLVFVKIALFYRLMYHFIVDNGSVQIIDKAGGVRWRTNEAGGKSGVTSTSSDNVFAKVYSAMMSKIHALLYDIKLGTKFTNAFGCG